MKEESSIGLTNVGRKGKDQGSWEGRRRNIEEGRIIREIRILPRKQKREGLRINVYNTISWKEDSSSLGRRMMSEKERTEAIRVRPRMMPRKDSS